MLYAIKGNKQLKIDEASKGAYLNMGFDIAEVDGNKLNIIEESPSKTITFVEHKKVVAALETENAELTKENKSLKEKLAEANKKLKEAGKE